MRYGSSRSQRPWCLLSLYGRALTGAAFFLGCRMWNVKLKTYGNEVWSVRTQYGRDNILSTLERCRAERSHPRDLDGLGRWALSVPFEDWLRLKAKYPDLACKDGKIQTKAWQTFIQSSESIPFRMRDKV